MQNIEASKVVVSSFIRIMKNMDKYEEIDARLRQISNKCSDRSSNPFYGFTNLDDLANKLFDVSSKQYRESRRTNDEYEFITMLVNNLLHFVYEPICNDKMSIGLVGQEIFDIACFRIYGDKYKKDMEKLNHGAKRPQTPEEAMLVGEFMSIIHSGREISWDEFLNAKRRGYNIEDLFKENNSEEDEIIEDEVESRDENYWNTSGQDIFQDKDMNDIMSEIMKYITIRTR
ncbi:MAG: hypothetical protein IKT40_11970 [Bacilli bacterium]|nr:hypothetical protein [Bacilli bacterium]